MLKTLKKSEFDILFEDNLMFDYYKHMIRYPDSLISRYLGVYELRVNKQSSIYLFITENMIGNDFNAIKRCYDLKGSLFQRITVLNKHD